MPEISGRRFIHELLYTFGIFLGFVAYGITVSPIQAHYFADISDTCGTMIPNTF